MPDQSIPTIQQKGTNVGIGTANPQFAGGGGLQINTNGTDTRLHLTNTTTGVTGTDGFELALVGNDVYYDSKESAGTHIFYTAGSERMRILSDGNVGIGTTDTQTFRLSVNGPNVGQGDTTTTIRVFDTTSATTGTGGGISFAGYFSGTSSIINTFSYIKGGKENSTAGDYASYLSFGTRVNGGSPTERMRITNGGNVGIGTTSPAARLSVNLDNFPSDGGIIARFTGGTTTPTTERFVEIFQSYTGAAFDSPMLVFRSNTNASNNSSYGIIRGTADGAIVLSNVNNTSAGVSAASERMRITGAGRVGIGTTGPICTLDLSDSGAVISGTATVGTNMKGLRVYNTTSATQNDAVGIWFSTGPHQAGIASFRATPATSWETTLAFYTHVDTTSNLNDATEKMRITGNGLVGIGNTSPRVKLTIDAGDVNGVQELVNLHNQNTNDLTGTSLTFSGYGATSTYPTWRFSGIKGLYDGNSGGLNPGGWGGQLRFFVNRGGSANQFEDVMTITGGARVGVGTASPEAIFHIAQANSGGSTTLYIDNSAGSAFNNQATIKFSVDAGASVTVGGASISAQNVNAGNGYTDLVFRTFGGSLSEKFRIGNQGDITNSLATGAAAFGNGINISTQQGTYTAGHGGILQFQNEDVITAGIRGIRTTGWGSAMLFYVHNESAGNTFGTTFVERMRITETGEIWMGYTTDQGAYLLQVNGSVFASAYYESSDIRLKDVITTRNSTTFGAIQYTWKDRRDEKLHWGYSAQDVKQWIPDAVEENKDGHYTLDYNQAHTYKIAMLEDRVAELEQELKQLKNK